MIVRQKITTLQTGAFKAFKYFHYLLLRSQRAELGWKEYTSELGKYSDKRRSAGKASKITAKGSKGETQRLYLLGGTGPQRLQLPGIPAKLYLSDPPEIQTYQVFP